MRMISTIALLLVLFTAVVSVHAADDPKPEDIGVTLVGVGVEEELAMDVGKHLLVTLQVPVHIRSLSASPTSPDALRQQVEAKREKGDLCVVALVKAPLKWPRIQLFPAEKSALLMPDAYEPLEPLGSGEKAKSWRLRIRKETVRAVATLIGVPTCMFPRCALLVDRNDRELDSKGYNTCPPCRSVLFKHLAGGGAVVRPRSQ